jgi:hypothetical protein
VPAGGVAAFFIADVAILGLTARDIDNELGGLAEISGALGMLCHAHIMTDGLANSRASRTRLIFFGVTWRRRDSPAHAFIDRSLALRAKFLLATFDNALHGITPLASGQKDKGQYKKQQSHLATKRPIRRRLSSAYSFLPYSNMG